jgi:hypothetical protein
MERRVTAHADRFDIGGVVLVPLDVGGRPLPWVAFSDDHVVAHLIWEQGPSTASRILHQPAWWLLGF